MVVFTIGALNTLRAIEVALTTATLLAFNLSFDGQEFATYVAYVALPFFFTILFLA